MRRLPILVLTILLLMSSVVRAQGGFSLQDLPQRVQGKHAVVYYTTEGEDAVDKAYAERVLQYAEQTYDRLVTKGGMRAPRMEPVPITIQAEDPSLGGAVNQSDLGLDLYMLINPRMTRALNLGDVVAHEYFHVLQASYEKGSARPKWAIEGTAPLAVMYTFDQGSAALDQALPGHLSLYWYGHKESMKAQDYMPSLFWYTAAEKYGGLKFLSRLLEWSADYEWERAAQLAALQGGAPASTTFDTLWRSFVLDMVDGRMPAGYTIGQWFDPMQVNWEGRALQVTRGERHAGTGRLGRGYAYYEPLLLAPYSFQLIAVSHESGAPLELTISGDPNVEAYAIKPGPRLAEALRSHSARPSHDRPAPPPADPATRGARLTVGQPLRLDGARGDVTLLLLVRTGHWGNGGYQLSLQPALPGAASPTWLKLPEIPQAPDSPGTPPPLSQAELKRLLNDGQWGAPTQPVEIDDSAAVMHKSVGVTIGDREVWDGEKVVTLPVAPYRDAGGEAWFPANAVAEALGARVEGFTFTMPDGSWAQVTPGSAEVRTTIGFFRMGVATRMENGILLVPSEFFGALKCDIRWSGEQYTFTWPRPE